MYLPLYFNYKMAGDMYLENLDEFIFDEDRVVTYRWLSQTLSVHVNQAKQMLETYVERQLNKANSPAVNVTYLVSGIQETESRVRVNKIMLVSDKDLQKTEAAMTQVLSKHVYSVQKAILKDSNSLYMTDYQVIKDSIRQPNRFSSIKCAEAKPRTPTDLAELAAQSGYPTSATNSPSKPKMNGSAEKHVIESLKQEPQKTIASKGKKGQITSFGGFAAANVKSSSEKSDGKEPAESGRQKKDEQKQTQQSRSKAKGGMMAFLNRPSTAKPKEEKQSSPPRQPTVVTHEETMKPSKAPERPPETKEGLRQGGKAKRKAARIDVSDSDSEEEKQTTKRRRRIMQQDSSSSSSEDELSDMEDSPIPPTPPPAPVDINSSDSEEEEKVTKGSSHMPSTTGKEPGITSPGSGKRRRKRRVLKNKTTIDEDGCMVTEKVWESDWTDVSEDEVPPTKKTIHPSATLSQLSPKEGGAKTGEEEEGKKKTSPGSGSGKAKQRSLMSFFKKK